MSKESSIGVGLYGFHGHQVHRQVMNHPRATLVGVADMGTALPDEVAQQTEVPRYETLDQLLADGNVQLVSLCSPRRADQADQAICVMEAGKHVYAEKPCAISEPMLDRLVETSRRTGCKFHEMAGTGFAGAYSTIRKQVQAGVIGQVVQVNAQKSYPYHDRRPQDEAIDAGLLMQAGIHGVRMVAHVACESIERVTALDTTYGNPVAGGELRMAAAMLMQLQSGGVATVTANYLNQPGTGAWGNDTLMIYGTKGVIESRRGGTETRLFIGDKDRGPIPSDDEAKDYFDHFVNELLDGTPMPVTLEEELHPTRIVIQAYESAR